VSAAAWRNEIDHVGVERRSASNTVIARRKFSDVFPSAILTKSPALHLIPTRSIYYLCFTPSQPFEITRKGRGLR